MSTVRRYRGGSSLGRRRVGGRIPKGVASGERQRRRRGRVRRLSRGVRRDDVSTAGSGVVEMGRRRMVATTARIRREGTNRERKRWRATGSMGRRVAMVRVGSVVRRNVGDRRERYVGRERMARSMYALVGYMRGSAYSTEAGRKYFRAGAFGSTWRVRGCRELYGGTGTWRREERRRRVSVPGNGGSWETERGIRRRVWVVIFKRGAVPMHRWMADVYEGAGTGVGLRRRVIPKVSLLWRGWWMVTLSNERSRMTPRSHFERTYRQMMRGRVGRSSVRVGAMGRIGQRRWKRWRVYSGRGYVGHRRRAMMGRRAWKPVREMLVVYRRRGQLMWGTRMVREVSALGKSTKERKYRTEMTGRAGHQKGRAILVTRGRSGRVGRPPRIGFGGKLAVYSERLGDGMWRGERMELELASRGLVASVVGAWGYLRRMKRLWMPAMKGREGGRRKASLTKESSRRRGTRGRRTLRGWRNGGARELARSQVGTE